VQIKVANNTVTDFVTWVTAFGTGTTMTVTGNTIVGPEAHPAVLSAGISCQAASSGSASGNAISNYFTDGAGGGCGSRVEPAVNPTLNATTFPAPGNEPDVWLDAWAGGALRRRDARGLRQAMASRAF
jgi:hypothetical protein